MSDSVLVIDNGSGYCKAGLAGEDKPVIIPCITGRDTGKDVFIGQDALDKRGILNLHSPVNRGVVQDWESMDAIWKYIFEKSLKINSNDLTVLMVGNSEIIKKNREKMYEIMFEKFNVKGMQVADESGLSLCASGRKSGIVCTAGDSVCSIVPIYEGVHMTEAASILNLGGRDLTQYLEKLLIDKGCSLAEQKNLMSQLNDVREQHSYIADNFDTEISKSSSDLERKISLLGGKEVVLDKERFSCTEPLCKPSLLGIDSPGLPELIFQSIMKCDMDVRKDLYHNVVFAGGLTMTPGFTERMKTDIGVLVPPAMTIQVSAPPDRSVSSWVGGSIFASSANFHKQTLSAQSYKECGLNNVPLCSVIF